MCASFVVPSDFKMLAFVISSILEQSIRWLGVLLGTLNGVDVVIIRHRFDLHHVVTDKLGLHRQWPVVDLFIDWLC